MSLKFKQIVTKDKNKKEDPLINSLNETFQTIGDELNKLRKNPVIEYILSLPKEEQINLIKKLQKL